MQRITGDPVKNGLQAHERFLEIVYKALREERLSRFVASMDDEFFVKRDDETIVEMLMCFDAAMDEFCTQWDESQQLNQDVGGVLRTLGASIQ